MTGDIKRKAPVSGELYCPPQNCDDRKALLLLNSIFAGALRHRNASAEVHFGVKSADLVIEHNGHKLSSFPKFLGVHSQPSATPVRVSATSSEPDKTAFRVEAIDQHAPMRGTVLGQLDEFYVEVGNIERRELAPIEVHAKWIIEDFDIVVRDAQGNALLKNDDYDARVTIINKMIEVAMQRDSDFMCAKLESYREQTDG